MPLKRLLKPRVKGIALLAFFLCATHTWAATLDVPGSYATIQAAIDAASAGDTVLVAGGTYTGTGNKEIDFLGKAITVKSSGGAASCIIDCQSSGRGFFFHGGETAASVLDGFTIQNGYYDDGDWTARSGGGIDCRSSPTIRNCVVRNCQAAHGGGIMVCEDAHNNPAPSIVNCAIYGNVAHAEGEHGYGGGIWVCYATPTIVNCVIYGNSAKYGGGIHTYFSGDPGTVTIVNCTICGNTASTDGGGLELHQSDVSVTNCILWNNSSEVDNSISNVSLTYSDVQGGYGGTGNLNADPSFVGATDFEITAASPCVDAGNGSVAPATDILGNPRQRQADIGAYEFQGTPPLNSPPTANAGPDQIVTDADRNGSEPVTLNGSGSFDTDGTISNYSWTEGVTALATGATPTVTLAVGTHTITLTVTDNRGATGTDTVEVVVNSPPTANAGPDQIVTDTDRNGSEPVTLNGSGSTDSDGTISSYSWTEGATTLGSGATPTVTLALGSHTITLTVTDDHGATGTDTVVVTISSPPLAVSLLCDGKTNPNNASTYTPVFAWTFSDADAGDSQSAYQLRVGTTAGAGNVWDTTEVTSTASSRAYAGGSLTPNITYYWQVQVWDQQGNASGYSNGTFVILDIGLRMYDGTQTVRIAVDYVSASYPLRISRGGTTYGIILVDPTDPSASKLRVDTPAGVKALKKM